MPAFAIAASSFLLAADVNNASNAPAAPR